MQVRNGASGHRLRQGVAGGTTAVTRIAGRPSCLARSWAGTPRRNGTNRPIISVKVVEGVFSRDQEAGDHRAPDGCDGRDRGREHAPGHVGVIEEVIERRLGHAGKPRVTLEAFVATLADGEVSVRGRAGNRMGCRPTASLGGCSLGRDARTVAQALRRHLPDEVVELNRGARERRPPRNPPGNEKLGVEVLAAYPRAATVRSARAVARDRGSRQHDRAYARPRYGTVVRASRANGRVYAEAGLEQPTFAGELRDGYLWGPRRARHEGPVGCQCGRLRRAR